MAVFGGAGLAGSAGFAAWGGFALVLAVVSFLRGLLDLDWASAFAAFAAASISSRALSSVFFN